MNGVNPQRETVAEGEKDYTMKIGTYTMKLYEVNRQQHLKFTISESQKSNISFEEAESSIIDLMCYKYRKSQVNCHH